MFKVLSLTANRVHPALLIISLLFTAGNVILHRFSCQLVHKCLIHSTLNTSNKLRIICSQGIVQNVATVCSKGYHFNASSRSTTDRSNLIKIVVLAGNWSFGTE